MGEVEDAGGCKVGAVVAPSACGGVTDFETVLGKRRSGYGNLMALLAAAGARGAGSAAAGEATGLAARDASSADDCDG
jgi:hypothetical protein